MGRINAACVLLQLLRLILGAPDADEMVQMPAAQQQKNRAELLLIHPDFSLLSCMWSCIWIHVSPTPFAKDSWRSVTTAVGLFNLDEAGCCWLTLTRSLQKSPMTACLCLSWVTTQQCRVQPCVAAKPVACLLFVLLFFVCFDRGWPTGRPSGKPPIALLTNQRQSYQLQTSST